MTDEFSERIDDDRPAAVNGDERSEPGNGDMREPVNGGTPEGINGDIPDLDLGIDVAEPLQLEDDELGAVLEALLLVVDTPVTVDALAAAIEQPAYRVSAKLQLMAEELASRESGIDLREAGGGWRMYTRAQYAPYVERLLLDGSRTKLTRAALETLAVVAYRQPVTRARVSAVRGVNVDAVVRTLLARGLITEAGDRFRHRRNHFRDDGVVPGTARVVVVDRSSRHRSAAARRRRHRRSQRNTRRRTAFREAQRAARASDEQPMSFDVDKD